MVKNLLVLSLVFLTSVAFGQLSIDIDPPTIHGEGGVDENDIEVHVQVTNTSDTTVYLLWNRHETEKPEMWWTWICDLQACYNWNTNSAPANRVNELRPQESMEFQVHAKPFGIAGFAQIDVDLFDHADPENILGTVTATFEASTSTSTEDFFKTDAIRVYPNPTTNFFRIYQADQVDLVEVYSMVGKRVLSYNANTNGQYDVSNLSEGMYLVRLLDRERNVIKTVRLSKS